MQDQLRELAAEILELCDASPSGTVLCADLHRLYFNRFQKELRFSRGLDVQSLPGVSLDSATPGRPGSAGAKISRAVL